MITSMSIQDDPSKNLYNDDCEDKEDDIEEQTNRQISCMIDGYDNESSLVTEEFLKDSHVRKTRSLADLADFAFATTNTKYDTYGLL